MIHKQCEGVLFDLGDTCKVVYRETREVLKKKKIKYGSWQSNMKLYSYGSGEPLNTTGEFEAARSIVWKKKQGQYLVDRLLNCWQYENRDKLCQ